MEALSAWRRKRASSVGNDLDGGGGGNGNDGASGTSGGNSGASGVTDGVKTRPVEPNATPSGSDASSTNINISSITCSVVYFSPCISLSDNAIG